jgi:hypothetical protein
MELVVESAVQLKYPVHLWEVELSVQFIPAHHLFSPIEPIKGIY